MAGKNNNEITTKFSVDIKELKSGIQEANRQIRLANAEFKAASTAMDFVADSADGIQKKIDQLTKVYDAQNKKLENYKDQLKLVEAEQGANSKAADELRITIANQQAAINKTAQELQTYNTKLTEVKTAQEQSADGTTEQINALDKLQSEIKEQEDELANLKDKYSNVVLEQGANSDSAKELAGEIDKLSSELKDNKSDLQNAENAADEFDNTLDDLEGSAKTTGGGLDVLTVALGDLVAEGINKAIGAIKDFIANSIEVGKNFDTSMSQVGAVSGATGDELLALRDKAKEMGASTKFTASEAADAFNYMAMAGWKTEDMISGIDGVLNLAAASGADLATTSDIVTDALTAMGYSAGDAGHLADVMAAASSNANTNVEMMGETFKYAAPLIGAMGYSMEDAAVQIGLMANAGIKAEQAGTSLRSILTRLAAPPKEAETAMKALKISLTDGEGNMKSLEQVMGDLRKAFSGLSETQQTQYAKQIAGQNAMSGFLAIVNTAPEDLEKLQTAVENCDGAAEDMANTMLDNLGGDMTLLQSKLESVQLEMYEKFEPAMRAGVDVLNKLLDAVQFVVDHSTEFIGALTAMGAAIATYVAYTTAIKVMKEGWMALEAVQKAVTAAQWLMNAAMNANPMGILISLLAALVAAIIYLWNNSEEFRNFWIGAWEKIKEVAQVAWEAISGFFSAAWEKIQSVWSGLVEFFGGLWEGIKTTFSIIANWINDNIFKPIMNFFNPVITFFKEAWEIIKQLGKGTWEAIKAIWSVVSEWFNTTVIQPAVQLFTNWWNNVKSNAETAWNFIKGVWNAVSSWFNTTVIQPVAKFFSGMWDGLKKGASKAWEGIKSVFSSVTSWFKEKFTAAWTAVKNVFSTGGKIFDGIKEGITSAFKNVVNAIIKGINKVIAIPFNAINDTLEKIRTINIAGAEPFKDLIKRFTVPQIPLLQSGGVLAKGQVGFLEGNGAEAVVPLENNKMWIAKTARDLRNALEAEGVLVGGRMTAPVTNYNFTQNNTSPKALSRLEIYRQTKNQLNFAKGV